MSALTQTDLQLLWAVEDSFKTVSAPTYSRFGTNASVDTAEASNNVQRIQALGQRTAEDILEQNFEGSFSLSFDVTDWNFLETMADPVDADSDTETDDFDFESVNSSQIVISRQGQSTARALKGCLVTGMSVEANVDETVTVTLDGIYADEEVLTSAPSATLSSNETLTFDEVGISYGTYTVSCPQSLTIDAESNVTLFRCLNNSGDRTAQDFGVGNFNPTVSITELITTKDDTSALERALGGTSVGDTTTDSITITFSGDTTVEFNLAGSLVNSYSENGISADAEAVETDIEEFATSLEVVVSP